ncbi:DUF6573 family protein [Xanthomonas axonopodis]
MDLIFSYSRKQAIEDGVLVDVTKEGRKKGFKVSVCMTSTAYDLAVEREEVGEGEAIHTPEERLSDVVHSAAFAAQDRQGNEAPFKVYRMREAGRKVIEMYAHIGPGDEAEPVITIMLIGED